ncbi:SAP domain-containing protein isoform X2 [Tasmannia lanceolata]|uniref:SAP domain-containing protein isoform X2 n=1 Tax=Tasmannia lanceolata TaxID=3420 RepID=UPI004062FDAD
MSSQYPVLDNRPIDQWKVTELKEELKRRKLITKGLKEDLIRRLDEAIQNEIESQSGDGELGNGFKPDPVHQVNCDDGKANPIGIQMVENATEVVVNRKEQVDDDTTMVDIDDSTAETGLGFSVQDGESKGILGTDGVVEGVNTDCVVEEAVRTVPVENSATDNQSILTELEYSGDQKSNNDESQVEDENPKPTLEDVKLNMSEPNNQVSEVSPVLGFQVKCESISTDSVSINEKNELKDNLNADNFHLELDVVKPEMVHPSSSDVPTIGGDLRSLDDQEPGGTQGSMEEINETSAANVGLIKKNDSADGGSSEKLNLDRSSGEESPEEDVLDSKQINPNHNSDEAVDRIELTELHVVKEEKEESPVDAMVADFSPDKKDNLAEKNNNLAISSEKRKLEAVGINEPSKRQRRWNSETLKVPEPQASNLTPSSTPKDAFQSTPKRIFNRSDSVLSGDTPKERVVPPSQKTATTSLRIDRFLRPFTLKAVQELLAKTGTVCNFWMDHIKTHCYVTFSSMEEAVETRNALYNLQWPLNGGRLLTAEFVDPQEVKIRVEAPPQSPVPVSISPTTPLAPPIQPQPSPRQNVLRQQLPPPPPLPPPPQISNPPPVRERVALPPPPPPPLKKPDPPVVTLDDLFRKTRTTPRIYYLPLSEEQVAAKLAAQGRNTKV